MVVGRDYHLRQMAAADAAAFVRVGFDAWIENRYYPEWFDPAVELRVRDALEKFSVDTRVDVIVCVVDGKVVGWGARDNLDHPGDRSKPYDYISDLWIDPPWQGRGIGTAILAELVHRMRSDKLARAQIEVAQANLRAIDLYIRNGFRETWRGVRMSETLGLPLPRILLEKPIL